MCDCEFCKISKKVKEVGKFLVAEKAHNLVQIIEDMMEHICNLGFESDGYSWDIHMAGWLKVEDHTPKEGSRVDIWCEGERICDLYYEKGKWMCHEHVSYEWEDPITHWKYVTEPEDK